MISYENARNEMQAKAYVAWQAAYTAVLGGTAPPKSFRVAGREVNPLPQGFWCRVALKPVIQDKANVGQLDDATADRYRSSGLIFLQVFAPKTDVEQSAPRLAANLRRQFVGSTTPGGVWFRRVTVDEDMPTEDQFVQVQMWAEWEFDEILE